jgi:hypothetical protein
MSASSDAGSDTAPAPPTTAQLDAYFTQLERDGYVVIPSVLTNAECSAAIGGIWQWLFNISGGSIKRSDPRTWHEPNEDHPSGRWPFCYNEKGIIQWYHSGHQQFVWDIRQHPAVVKVFAKLWSCPAEDLLVSYDAVNVQRPIEWLHSVGQQGHTDRFNERWLHIDQSAGAQGRQCVQSFVNLNDSQPDDGCLIVLPGSHLHFQAMCEEFKVPDNPKQWIRLQDEHRRWYKQRGLSPLRVAAPRGSLVMWDSRTVHTAGTAQPGRVNKQQFRYVVYVCYLPRALASEEDLKLKRRLVQQGRLTNHWPVRFIKVFSQHPSLPSSVMPRYQPVLDAASRCFRPPTLSELGRRLAGF